jgi:hypothetical protein
MCIILINQIDIFGTCINRGETLGHKNLINLYA